jgi:hypothetical protein
VRLRMGVTVGGFPAEKFWTLHVCHFLLLVLESPHLAALDYKLSCHASDQRCRLNDVCFRGRGEALPSGQRWALTADLLRDSKTNVSIFIRFCLHFLISDCSMLYRQLRNPLFSTAQSMSQQHITFVNGATGQIYSRPTGARWSCDMSTGCMRRQRRCMTAATSDGHPVPPKPQKLENLW